MPRPKRFCSFEGCGLPAHSKGLCSGHRIQRDKGQELRPLREFLICPDGSICKFDECDSPVYCKLMCRRHYDREKHAEKMATDLEYAVKKLARSRSAHQREDPIKRAEQNLAWCRANRESRRESCRRRQAQHKGAECVDIFTKADIWQRDGGICGICLLEANENDWHLDHIIPLSRGGQHTLDNVQVSHPPCNLSKKDKLMEEYYEYIEGRNK